MQFRGVLGYGAPTIAVCAALALGGCRCESDSAATNDPAQRQRLTEQIDAFADRLARVRSALPPAADIVEQPCPDDDFRIQIDGGYADMLLVDDDLLARFQRPELQPYAEERQPWQVLTARVLREIEPPQADHDIKQLTDTLFRIQKLERQYRFFAVLRADRKQLPREEGGKFRGGVFEGWLVVVELPTAERLCQASVLAESSQEVAGYESTQRSAVLWQDFRRHLVRGLNDAARRMTRRLNLVIE